MEDTTLTGIKLLVYALNYYCMQYIQFILESKSNKDLDTFSKEIIHAIKSTGAVKSGPIPFKGKRIIYCYNSNIKTIDRLMHINSKKYDVITAVTFLENPQ